MNEEIDYEMPVDNAVLIEVGVALGQSHAFGLVAGRCSAAQADGLRRIREGKLYKACTEKWEEFCRQYLNISRSEADRTIKLLEEFGPAYFEMSQLTRVSPETFRAIAPAIQDNALHHNGEAIELNAENARRVAAAVAEMRGAGAPKPRESAGLMARLKAIEDELTLAARLEKLDKCCTALVAAFEKIAADPHLDSHRPVLKMSVSRMHSELERLAAEHGLT